jgi:hypothetical protein
MSIKHPIAKGLKIKWKGIFDWEKLYKLMKRWLDFEGYGNELENFKEKKYKERIQAGGKLLEIVWEGTKKVSSYYNFVIEVTFLIIGMKEVEVELEGRRVKMNKGEIEMRFNAYVLSNASDKLDDNSWFVRVYESWIGRDRLEQHKIDLYKKLMKFQDVIKEELNLYRF